MASAEIAAYLLTAAEPLRHKQNLPVAVAQSDDVVAPSDPSCRIGLIALSCLIFLAGLVAKYSNRPAKRSSLFSGAGS